MESLNLVEQLLGNIELEPLSKSIPLLLPIALECRDYKGFCVLSQLITPIADNSKINTIQTNEIIRNLLLQGLSKEYIVNLVEESKKEFIEIKSLAVDQVSSHSIKEIEEWIPEAKRLTETTTNITRETYQNLFQRIAQMQRLYESMRGYVVNKLTYYKQVLNLMNKQEAAKTEHTNVFLQYNDSKVFVVHGHNGELKEAIARLIEKQGIQAIVLHEQANQGATIIEKIERNSDVGCAICLFTADDVGRAKADLNENTRARQNVVFEAGYFIGKLGRDKVILIADRDVEIPSDLQGVVYTDSSNWRFSVLQEMKAIGYNIDYNKLE